ncbi:MAG: hypothetical protein PHU42_01460 [Patescibacteria group bacterium]|nr:hypothetical protein [Patescibacteria group bacterium]
MIDKTKLIKSEWEEVDKYIKKDNSDGMKLAVIEAENVFIRTVEARGYKAKSIEEKILLALKEVSTPETFLKSRERALLFKNKAGFESDDPYEAREIVDNYKKAIEDILFGIIDEKKFQSLKIRFWRFYHPFFINRKKIYRFLFWCALLILIMLFIADTDLGKNLFDSIIDKIHLIIRVILFVLFIAFTILFFITFSIILLESRSKKRYQKRNGAVDK